MICKYRKIKNYTGRLTLTKIYLNADKNDHNKKIKNDPLVEFALYDNKDLKNKSLGETFLGYWSEGVNMLGSQSRKKNFNYFTCVSYI